MARVEFVKMEGAGNDYVYVDAIQQPWFVDRAADLAVRLADRHFGVGGDGLIVLSRGEAAPARMAMWNADGSRGAMCGNGLRCLAKLAHDHGHVRERAFAVETDSGLTRVELVFDGDGAVVGARIELAGVEVAAEPTRTRVGGREVDYHVGDAGNPHAVVFVDAPDDYPVLDVGAAMQTHADFPDGVNVEFVAVGPDGALRQRTFERGSGETLACGSGAGFAATVAHRRGLVEGPEVAVDLRGGRLTVSWRDAVLVIAGPARTVYRGEIDLPTP